MSLILRTLSVITAVVLGCTAAAATQTASPVELRAAFVYNFAKFTEWPAHAIAPNDPIAVCVVNDLRASDLFRQVVKGRAIGSRGLAVRELGLGPDLKSCQIVYAPQLDAERAADLLAAVSDAPVLTISDYEHFARMGGIANFVVEDGKMRFAINVEAAQRAHLRVSSQLLALARVVRGTDARK
jgi:hypothetical protein